MGKHSLLNVFTDSGVDGTKILKHILFCHDCSSPCGTKEAKNQNGEEQKKSLHSRESLMLPVRVFRFNASLDPGLNISETLAGTNTLPFNYTTKLLQ